ncbi:MAG: hypothetical protein KJO79_04855 [Verrucomicrobiae bacterium]|nr:hypothetical protein [Verrucomicrobiae bacterium]NNJ86487.1 hypothetical protein [Akkermansiaceae bacterium]
MKHIIPFSILLSLCLCLQAETLYFNGSDFRGGYVIVPDDLPKGSSKSWVVVDVHGAGGLRNESFGHRLKKVLEPDRVIFLVPSFTSGYQGGDGKWAEQLIEHFKWVQKRYAVHDKMFVHGHSGGGQFAHRFAFSEPKYVVGVSAHSSGSWACSGGYGTISSRAKGIPFAISCGEKDTALSVAGAPHNRISWYKLFNAEMQKKGFVVAHTIWPGLGHGVSPRHYGPMLKECFLLATRGVIPTSDFWHGDDLEKIAKKAQQNGGRLTSNQPRGPSISAKDRQTLQAANDKIVAGEAPDNVATMRFLAKYPAPRWAADKKLEALKNHCKKAAESYLKKKKSQGAQLSGAALEKFKQATDGLGIEIE